MTRLISFALSLLLLTTSANACLHQSTPSSDGPGHDASEFPQILDQMKSLSFVKTYCAFTSTDKQFARDLFNSAARSYSGEDKQTLARLSIMIPDIRENVAYVAANGEIREVDDEWESIGVMRVIEHMLVRFPETKSVLTSEVLAETENLFQRALEAVSAGENRSDSEIQKARETIADYERKTKALLDKIQTLGDPRRHYRAMRQELELQLRK